jgi:Rrf2 family iron-sulfur cluster assembly transcriptional regulator
VEADGPEDAAPGAPSPLQEAVTLPLWGELEAMLVTALGELTVAELLRRAAAKGLRRPTPEALNFAI